MRYHYRIRGVEQEIAAAAVFFAGVGAATATYAKNRTDRHNAAVDRGEVRTVDQLVAEGYVAAAAGSGVAGRARGPSVQLVHARHRRRDPLPHS